MFADADYDGVVEVTAHAKNDSDLTVALIHMRAAALSALGHQTAAFDAFKDALAKTANRDEGLLATVRYDRALAYEQAGQKAKARADFERLYGADPAYRDVRERLAVLGLSDHRPGEARSCARARSFASDRVSSARAQLLGLSTWTSR